MGYIKRLLISIDQLGNTALDGDPDETISSRVGRNAVQGKVWAIVIAKVIDYIALTVFDQKNHCRNSIGT